MKDTQVAGTMSLHQHLSSWSGMHTKGSTLRATGDSEDLEPFRKPPAPSVFQAPEILSHFRPDPLLLVTPEKNLGFACLDKNNSATKEEVSSINNDIRRGRQRVRFAPGIQTSSPPALSGIASGSGASALGAMESAAAPDDDSVPRSFSSVSQRLYQPALYADSDEETGIKTVFPGASTLLADAPAPKQYVVENRRGGGTVYVPLDHTKKKHTTGGFSSEKGSSGRTVKAKVIRHKPTNFSDDSDNGEGSDAEVKETLSRSHVCPVLKSPIHFSRTSSSSPHRNHRPSSGQSSPASKSPCRSPSSKSPSRLTPTGGVSEMFSFNEDEPQPDVRVVREAPLRPKLNDYVFPFHSDKEESSREYDSTMETPLARPEFNSTVKISEELKTVKARRPDTWGAVSETLRKSDMKRTQIQEKASSKVNVQLQSGLFSGLVDIDVPLNDLCHNVEHGITLRAPPTLPAPAKVVVGREPDLMEFFSPDIQQELPDLTLTGIQPVVEKLTTANPALAFDLYRHNRSWDGLTDS